MLYLNRLLADAVKTVEGGHSADGQVDTEVCKLAYQHSADMANRGVMDHTGFTEQRAPIAGQGRYPVHENVAQVPVGTPAAAAQACVRAWATSPEHKTQMDAFHGSYCYSMEFRGNTAYCTGLFVN
jgi:hypothetical protein